MKTIAFDDLPHASLHPGCICRAGPTNDFAADPIAKLLPVGNQGGIRAKGSVASPALIVLKTNWQEPEWPNFLDPSTHQLAYFGDNRRPGSPLEKPRGNQYLSAQFRRLHSPGGARRGCAPFLVFDSVGGRDVRFLGMAVPGAHGISHRDDLVAFWTHTPEGAFLNYRAVLTLFPTTPISRSWLDDVVAGADPAASPHCPSPFERWVRTGFYC